MLSRGQSHKILQDGLSKIFRNSDSLYSPSIICQIGLMRYLKENHFHFSSPEQFGLDGSFAHSIFPLAVFRKLPLLRRVLTSSFSQSLVIVDTASPLNLDYSYILPVHVVLYIRGDERGARHSNMKIFLAELTLYYHPGNIRRTLHRVIHMSAF